MNNQIKAKVRVTANKSNIKMIEKYISEQYEIIEKSNIKNNSSSNLCRQYFTITKK